MSQTLHELQFLKIIASNNPIILHKKHLRYHVSTSDITFCNINSNPGMIKCLA